MRKTIQHIHVELNKYPSKKYIIMDCVYVSTNDIPLLLSYDLSICMYDRLC